VRLCKQAQCATCSLMEARFLSFASISGSRSCQYCTSLLDANLTSPWLTVWLLCTRFYLNLDLPAIFEILTAMVVKIQLFRGVMLRRLCIDVSEKPGVSILRVKYFCHNRAAYAVCIIKPRWAILTVLCAC
jgi:hypothetical protein